MSDRTSAELFRRLFRIFAFAQEEAGVDMQDVARSVLELTNDYDFTPHQMEADDDLRTLGIYDDAYAGWGSD